MIGCPGSTASGVGSAGRLLSGAGFSGEGASRISSATEIDNLEGCPAPYAAPSEEISPESSMRATPSIGDCSDPRWPDPSEALSVVPVPGGGGVVGAFSFISGGGSAADFAVAGGGAKVGGAAACGDDSAGGADVAAGVAVGVAASGGSTWTVRFEVGRLNGRRT